MKSNIDISHYDFYKTVKSFPFVEKIVLFGSRARKDNKERSDIDLAVFCPSATDSEWLKILDVVDEASTLLKIDCLRWDKLSTESILRKNIEKEGVVLYVKDET